MTRPATIRFQDRGSVDHLIVAIRPVDAWSGQIIRFNPSDIELCDEAGNSLLKRGIQNLAGAIAFVRKESLEDELSAYTIKINAENYGYFSPEEKKFPDPDDPQSINHRHLDVALHPLPAIALPDNATVFSGFVVDSSEPAEAVRIAAQLPAEILPPGSDFLAPFTSESDFRGAFVLPIRLPLDAHGSEAKLKFIFSRSGESREIEIPFTREVDGKRQAVIEDSKRHSFEQAIDLSNNETPSLKVTGA